MKGVKERKKRNMCTRMLRCKSRRWRKNAMRNCDRGFRAFADLVIALDIAGYVAEVLQ